MLSDGPVKPHEINNALSKLLFGQPLFELLHALKIVLFEI